jgi:tetratricopeptide (TPR) repeat protein
VPSAPAERAAAQLALARVAWRADADAARARAHLAAAAEAAGDTPVVLASVLSFRATLANEAERDAARAEADYAQALRLLAAEPQAHGHLRRGLRYNLAITAVYAGRSADALPELQALAGEAAAAGDRHLLAQVLNARGSALEALGRLDEAEAATRAALAEAWATLETENALYALWNLGPLALARGDAARAARLMAFADRFWRTHFGALAASDARDVARTRRRCRQRLGRAAGQRCWDEGAELPLAAAVALALDLGRG